MGITPYRTFFRHLFLNNRTVFLIAALILPFGASVHAQSPDEKITVSADKISRNKKKGLSSAEGNVVIKQKEMTLFCDSAEINSNDGTGIVDGNVRLVMPEAEIKASRASLNLDTTFGTLYDVKGRTKDGRYFTGKKMRKVSKTRYLVDDATFTSCAGEKPGWLIKSSYANIKLESVAWFTNVRLHLLGVPILYFPIFAAPTVTKRTTGLLAPTFGVSSVNGSYLNNAFFWAKSESDDVTIYHDYMDLRGHRAGLEYRYAFAEKTRGQANYNYIYDRKLGQALWNLKYQHRQKFKNGVDSRARLDFESQTSYSKEFNNELSLFSMRYTDSYVNVTDNRADTAVSLTAREQRSIESERKELFDRRPELKFSMMPHEIFGTRFVAEIPATAASFRSEIRGGGADSDTATNRLTASPEFSVPFSPVSSFNIKPFVTGRLAWYSRGANEEKAFSTEYYTAGAVVEGPRIFRLFKGKNRTLKHIITPTLGYNFVPGYDVDGDDRQIAPQIDTLDKSLPASALTFSLLQRLLVKKDAAASQVVYFNAVQKYDFREANRRISIPGDKRKPLSNLFLDLDTRPFSWIVLNADASYNHYDSDYDTVNFELGLLGGGLAYLSYDRRFIRNPKSIFHSGLLGINVTKRFTAELSAIYDEVNGEYTNHLIDFSYRSGCWGASLTIQGRKRMEQLSGGGVRQEWENKYFFLITLKGLGEQGARPQPLVGRKL
ncbi:MAG: LPS-assembly protein LptD [Nitrospinota bacterium]